MLPFLLFFTNFSAFVRNFPAARWNHTIFLQDFRRKYFFSRGLLMGPQNSYCITCLLKRKATKTTVNYVKFGLSPIVWRDLQYVSTVENRWRLSGLTSSGKYLNYTSSSKYFGHKNRQRFAIFFIFYKIRRRKQYRIFSKNVACRVLNKTSDNIGSNYTILSLGSRSYCFGLQSRKRNTSILNPPTIRT